jgi:hypothetical protein
MYFMNKCWIQLRKTIPKTITHTHTFPTGFSFELRMLIKEKRRYINYF